MNRVQDSITIVREHLAGCTPEQIASTDATLALDFEEHFSYQQLQAEAHVSGKLSTEEAQIIYAALGEVGSPANGGWSSGVDTATKYAVTLTIQALLKQRIAGRA